MEQQRWTTRKGARTEKCLRCGSMNMDVGRRKCRECKATEEYARRIKKLETQATEPCAFSGCRAERYRLPSQWSSYCQEHHKLVRRDRRLQREYGLSPVEYERLMAHGACQICGRSERRRLVVDHCHASGQVRGVLCDDCNVALGLLQDDRERILAALDYLDRTGVQSRS